MGLLKVYAMPIALGHAAGCKRARTEPPARKSFSKKTSIQMITLIVRSCL